MEPPVEETSGFERELPDAIEREEILRTCIALREEESGRQLFKPGIQFDLVAERTEGFSQAELAALISQVADDRERRSLPRVETEELILYIDEPNALRNCRSSKAAKSAAGSAPTQAPNRRSKRK